uniref:Uncharacterized protein n=1 Tax=Compsopogon caeruleus TaxID=31354 RepID=A0A6T6DEP8_9RHOD|mmetsp:Transcript_8593/g.17411  ORF Transcript_8593/g.17411 Transcript_8593/m.17411 type:complete len:114 (+) Transcript_8593:95-436(+)
MGGDLFQKTLVDSKLLFALFFLTPYCAVDTASLVGYASGAKDVSSSGFLPCRQLNQLIFRRSVGPAEDESCGKWGPSNFVFVTLFFFHGFLGVLGPLAHYPRMCTTIMGEPMA